MSSATSNETAPDVISLDMENPDGVHRSRPTPPPTVSSCGLALAAFAFHDAVAHVDALVASREPAFFITANLNYAMLTQRDARLVDVNRRAAFVVADGMPLVWAAWLRGTPLPGRVTGSDLTPAICNMAAERGYPVFLLGGADGVAVAAAARLQQEIPALQIVGIENPMIDRLSPDETSELMARIRGSGARLVFAGLSQPSGEIWLSRHYCDMGAVLAVQVGATIDFIAGRVRRAPRWMQRAGLEWGYRLMQEPRRLVKRYAANGWFFAGQLIRALLCVGARRGE